MSGYLLAVGQAFLCGNPTLRGGEGPVENEAGSGQVAPPGEGTAGPPPPSRGSEAFAWAGVGHKGCARGRRQDPLPSRSLGLRGLGGLKADTVQRAQNAPWALATPPGPEPRPAWRKEGADGGLGRLLGAPVSLLGPLPTPHTPARREWGGGGYQWGKVRSRVLQATPQPWIWMVGGLSARAPASSRVPSGAGRGSRPPLFPTGTRKGPGGVQLPRTPVSCCRKSPRS